MDESRMPLRSFDSYDSKLGDEMRGERATIGKSLEEVGADLRIDAAILGAIENCDHRLFPNRNLVAGYVRSYARYLRLDPNRCYRQFCQESGFKSPSAENSVARHSKTQLNDSPKCAIDKKIATSRFTIPSAAIRSISFSIPTGTVFSSATLAVTLGVMLYAGYSVLQNIQRVGVVPALGAPEIVTEAPEATLLADNGALQLLEPENNKKSDVNESTGLVAKPNQGPDGPISEINPGNYGVFVAINGPITPETDVSGESADNVSEPVLTKIAVHAIQDAWVQIVNDSDVILFQGILRLGQSFQVPDSVASPNIHIGNAGGVYIRVENNIYGPTGKPGQVIKGFPLTEEGVRTNLPKVDELGTEAKLMNPIIRQASVIFQ